VKQIICPTLCVAALGLVATARPAHADREIEVGGFLGHHWWNDDNELGRDDEAQDPIDNSFIAGLRAALRVREAVSIEGELAYLPASTRDNDIGASVLAYRLQLLVHPWRFASNKLEPFGVIGIGGTTVFSDDTSVLFDDSDFVWHVGVGARYYLRHDLGIRLDVRLPVAPAVVDTATMDAEVLVGLFKTFGGREEPVRRAEEPDRDSDRDGILDAVDRCPHEPETVNSIEDADGCPDVVPDQVKAFTGVIKGVEFETDSDTLRASSSEVLDKAVAVLTEFPNIKLEIGGYTDSQGSVEHNRQLSQRRADAVKKYLVDRGVSSERLEAVGYGPDKPIADNSTAVGRQQNRRVEFLAK
jgi:outer membrane protein OmpA-like peptidoglycan-associated protein